MKIKEYDFVKYQNNIHRVMSITSRNTVKIATYGPVHVNSLELAEKATLPSLSVGDRVIVKSIPLSERNYYPTGWRDEMTKMVENEDICRIEDTDWGDNTLKVGRYWFAPYHLEKVEDYDIV